MSPDASRDPAPAEATIEQLVLRVAQGDVQAFTLLHDAVSAALFVIVLRAVRDRGQTQEVVQEVLLEIWDKAHRFHPARGSAMAWIATIAHRRAVDRVRTVQAATARDVRAGLLEHTTPFDHVSEQVEQRLSHQQVRTCLGALTDLQRQAVVLAFYHHRTYQEIADLLDLPLATAKSRVRDALLRLRKCLGEET